MNFFSLSEQIKEGKCDIIVIMPRGSLQVGVCASLDDDVMTD